MRVNLADLVNSFHEYFIAKIGVDTAENGPLKVCQKLAKTYCQVRIHVVLDHRAEAAALVVREDDDGLPPLARVVGLAGPVLLPDDERLRHLTGKRAAAPLDRANVTGLVLGCIEAKFCN